MISFSISDLLSVVSAVSAVTVLLLSFMIAYSHRRQKKYDEIRHRAELELMRRSIESKMYGLNEKLLATENRWRDVNHLLISSQNLQSEKIETTEPGSTLEFLRSANISPNDITVDRGLIFVLTPFHPNSKNQFNVISKVCTGLGLRVMRGDEEFVSGDIFPHILRLIIRARIIIANIDGRNPNVFYELGIAHALGKPTILIAPTPEDVPFDLRTKRLILFKSMNDLQDKLRDELARVIVSTEPKTSPNINTKKIPLELLPEARILLKEASQDRHGIILHARYLDGESIHTNEKDIISSNDRREISKWHEALNQLSTKGLVVARDPERKTFEVSHIGYQVADMIDF